MKYSFSNQKIKSRIAYKNPAMKVLHTIDYFLNGKFITWKWIDVTIPNARKKANKEFEMDVRKAIRFYNHPKTKFASKYTIFGIPHYLVKDIGKALVKKEKKQ